MTEAQVLSKLALPVPRRLELDHFSLYRNRPRLEIEFRDGVCCLAGANGLGKSTFITTVNYAITGVAADPSRKFDSLNEYYKYAQPYARSYYIGRISDLDRDVATVRLTMSVREQTYVLERGFFEPDALRFFEVTDADQVIVPHDDAESDADRDASYKRRIVADTGLADFEQLVFLQHFLLTFDERRRLLLWDDQTIEQTLLLAFGVDPHQARKADDWRRKVERLESQARNLQYQATTAKNRIVDLRKRVADLAGSEDEDFERVEREREAVVERLKRLREEEASARVSEAEADATVVTAEQTYEAAFARLTEPHPRQHPLVRASLHTDICAVCAAEGAATRIGRRLDAGECPLCGAVDGHDAEANAAAADDLDARDQELAQARATAAAVHTRRLALTSELEEVERELVRLDSRRATSTDIDGADSALTPASVRALISQYEREAHDATVRRTEFRAKRDEYRRMLQPIARELAQRYAEAERLFVPRFSELAHSFLGLEVDVYLQQRASEPSLIVSVEGSERRTFDKLSESQRYFLDIALRMALVEHMSGQNSQACLYIDTPEGSLDIAYEARAGRMFAEFVIANNRLIMTANINTSRLLQALAAACGPEMMQIIKMIEWTRLSDVQAEGEALFAEAFAELDDALSTAGDDS